MCTEVRPELQEALVVRVGVAVFLKAALEVAGVQEPQVKVMQVALAGPVA